MAQAAAAGRTTTAQAMRLTAEQQRGAAVQALQSLDKDGDGPNAEQIKNQDVVYRRFCDMLRHPSAHPLVAEIKKLTLSFPDKQDPYKAADRIHAFLTAMEEKMFADIVVFSAEADDEGRSNAAEGLEKFVIGKLYSKIFDADGSGASVDAALMKQLDGLQWVRLKHLGINGTVDLSLFPRALDELRQIDQFKAPRDKLICILNACRVINDVLKLTHAGSEARALSADDFLPLLILAVLQARPPRLHSNVEFVAAFRHPARLMGEEAYFVTALQSAVAFVQQAGPEAFEVSKDEYETLFAESSTVALAKEVCATSDTSSSSPAAPADSSPSGQSMDLLQAGQGVMEDSKQALDMASAGEATVPETPPRDELLPKQAEHKPQRQLQPRQPHQHRSSPVHIPTVEESSSSSSSSSPDKLTSLFERSAVAVYRIPSGNSSGMRQRAEDWSERLWSGYCRVGCNKFNLILCFEDPSTAANFVQSEIANGDWKEQVWPAIDSGRHFVVRAPASSLGPLLGIEFESASDALDFKSVFLNFKMSRSDVAAAAPAPRSSYQDLSLKKGDKITVRLKGAGQQAASAGAADIEERSPPRTPSSDLLLDATSASPSEDPCPDLLDVAGTDFSDFGTFQSAP
mmetsp:Transcript_13222/g.30924  ORF Transcript_13222/g.30924 Transcript_13222/m.30924 type:complete len:630 (+) Transcript_13222:156-2045(+)